MSIETDNSLHQEIKNRALKLVTQEEIDSYIEKNNLEEIVKLDVDVAWVCFRALYKAKKLGEGWENGSIPKIFPKTFLTWFEEKGEFLFPWANHNKKSKDS